MSINLLDLVKNAVGSQLGPLAGILGDSEDNTNSAVNAAIPAILGGLMKKSSTQGGTDEIFKTLDDHDGGILDNLGGLLGGGQHTELQQKGGGILDMIFGANHSGLLGTLARISGMADGKIGTLLGVLAPVVMGVLGKQRRSQGLDASGLSSLLSSQKDHLAGVMPGELSDSLGLADVFANASDAASRTVESASDVAANARKSASDTAQATGQAGGSLLMALLPLVLLVVLAFMAWNFFTSGTSAKNGAAANAGLNLPKIELPGFPTQEIGTTFGDLTKSIGDIKDLKGAEAVVPQLQKAGEMLDEFDFNAIASGPQKEAVGGLFAGLLEKLKAALETAYSVPGVEGVLKPVVDQFLERFAVLGL